MKKLLILMIILSFPNLIFSAGFTQHQFMGELAINLLSNEELSSILKNHLNEVLVGSSYPDAGYAVGNKELSYISHTTAFVDAFITYIKKNYPYPYTSNYDLISFLIGISSHVADDGPYHTGFIAESAIQDFNGNYEKAHTYCDAGLDFVTIVDFDRDIRPTYWVPVADLIKVYESMGYFYDEKPIILGNIIIILGGIGERIIADRMDRYLQDIMPWSISNYYTFENGGLLNGATLASFYYEEIWERLLNNNIAENSINNFLYIEERRETDNPIFKFAYEALKNNWIKVDVKKLKDGSVIIYQPKIINWKAVNNYLKVENYLKSHKRTN